MLMLLLLSARDWNKVTNYCKRLGILSGDFTPNYTK
jgi:pyrimidine precursor biosynthesis enzyme